MLADGVTNRWPIAGRLRVAEAAGAGVLDVAAYLSRSPIRLIRRAWKFKMLDAVHRAGIYKTRKAIRY
jgi:hypothetical protein